MRDHVPPAELFTLNDYRTRHAQYRTDPDLQAAHAAFPFLMTWDDHEFKDNYADLDLDPDQPLETVAARRAAAYLAYWEHAPLPRSRKPVGKDMPLFRRAAVGRAWPRSTCSTRASTARTSCAAQCDAGAARPRVGLLPRRARLDARRSSATAQRDWLFDGLAAPGAAGT